MSTSFRLALVCILFCACHDDQNKAAKSAELKCERGGIQYEGQLHDRAALTCGGDATSGANEAHYCSASGACVAMGSCESVKAKDGVPCELNIDLHEGGGIARNGLVATNQRVVWVDMGPNDELGNYLHKSSVGEI